MSVWCVRERECVLEMKERDEGERECVYERESERERERECVCL